jgi:hypothetical protein
MDKHEPFDALVARLGFTRAVQQIVDESFAGADQRTQELFGNRQNLLEDEPATVWNDELEHAEKVSVQETLGDRNDLNHPGLHLV